jgi:uncharacterized protein (DUF849 family)
LSTSGRIAKSFEERSEVIELKPDMCSLTLSSLNFINQASLNAPEMIISLAEKMKKFGVHPELECFDMGMINYGKHLIKKGHLTSPFYWNLLFGNIAGMQAELIEIGNAIRSIEPVIHAQQQIALAGLGQDQLKVNAIAIASGFGVRVGLEDNIWIDRRKTRFATNKELLKRVHELMEIHEQTLMSPTEFGKLGFYNEHTTRI